MQTSDSLPRIVVLGAGFAGLTFCQKFPRNLARVTIIDRQNHHLFQPLLYQVATATLSGPDIAQPIRSILSDHPDIEVRMSEVQSIDLKAKKVILAKGEVAYDYLVIGLGGVTSYFGRPDWAQFAPGLKSLDEALALRRETLLAYERAETEADPAARDALLTTVVVGGGPTGVEMAGALAELARTVIDEDFRHIDPKKTRVLLVEAGPRLLPMFPEALSASAKLQLEKLGVEVLVASMVKDIRKGEVELPTQTIRSANIIWAAGVAANPLTRSLGIEIDRGGRIKVQPDLSLPGYPEVLAVGDVVSLVDVNGVTVPGVAPAALQMGGYAAKLIAKELKDGKGARAPFAYHDKGSLATIGRSSGIAKIGKLQFSGFFAWFAWLIVHLLFLVGFRSKVSVLTHWVYNYFTYKRGTRLVTGMDPVVAKPAPKQS